MRLLFWCNFMEKSKDKKISLEIIRFLITGVICALLDFATMYLVTILMKNGGANDTLINVISTLAGFIVGVIANYILSTLWVFKNVKDKNKSKTPMFIFLFVVLSAGAWALSYGTWELCFLACKSWWQVNINEIKFSFAALATLEFWLFAVSFGMKTLVGMIWNYLTRKFILYKAPKEDEELEKVDEEHE